MKNIFYIILFIAAVIVIQYIRFKLTQWEKIVEHFESERRTELKPIYGYWSEFRRSPKSYPLGNAFLKLAPTNFGLYIQYDLKYEPIKFYKPVMIPWSYISIRQSKESKSKGGDEYIIQENENHLGSLYLQTQISEQLMNSIKALGVELNFIEPVNQ